MRPVNDTNKKTYQFILNFLMSKGRYPKHWEIGKEFGITRQAAKQRLQRMDKEGYLVKGQTNTLRNFRLLEIEKH
jgi:predicted transcriptional regulator